MRANFGLFCSFTPKFPGIHVGLRCDANVKLKINREKGYYWVLNSSHRMPFLPILRAIW